MGRMRVMLPYHTQLSVLSSSFLKEGGLFDWLSKTRKHVRGVFCGKRMTVLTIGWLVEHQSTAATLSGTS